MRLFVITQSVDSTHVVLGFFVEWLRAFRAHPFVSKITVASFDASHERIDGLDIHRIAVQGKLDRIRSMWNLLRSSDWDVLFVHMTPIWCIACWPIVLLKRKKMVLWYTHGSSSVALRVACLLANEVYTATAEAFPIRSSKCFAIGHGIPEHFGLIERNSGDGHRYLSVGRLSRRKRIVEMLAFFDRIRHVDPLASLTLAGSSMGDAAYETEIHETIERLRLESCVHLIGAIASDRTPELYAAHDVFLHLSATGSLDKVVIEALMGGCVVFSTNPATAEGLGLEWFWDGSLDDEAAAKIVGMAKHDLPVGLRARIAKQYGLTAFIDRCCTMMANLR